MAHLLEDLQAFLQASPTSWHAVEEMGNRLAVLDYIPLNEKETWHLELGKRYFVSRGGSFCAFILPKKKPKNIAIVAAHTDSPSLKIKPLPEVHKENMTLLGVDLYGGPIIASWLGRDLAIAGRVMVLDSDLQMQEKIVYIDDAPLLIPYLAIHLDREVNDKGLLVHKQDQLIPIATLDDTNFKQSYLEILLRRHLSFHSLLSFDLFLVPIEAPRFIGSSGEMLASYRLDNLASTHAALVAIGEQQAASNETLQMAVFWDHEEIGSETETGADSSFFEDILHRIAHHFHLNTEEFCLMKRNANCLSIDMAHGFHPQYENRFEPNHKPLLGKGIVIKYNAQMRYTTTAEGASLVLQLCQKLNLRSQSFVYRADAKPGSTVGPIIAKKLGINTVDIGCPQLSMHATREVMACQDYLDMCTLLTHFLKGDLQ